MNPLIDAVLVAVLLREKSAEGRHLLEAFPAECRMVLVSNPFPEGSLFRELHGARPSFIVDEATGIPDREWEAASPPAEFHLRPKARR